MSFTEFDSHCMATPIDLIKPEDEQKQSKVFSIDSQVTFTAIPRCNDPLEEDEDEDDLDIDDLHSYTAERTYEVQYDRLIGESTRVSAIWDMLADMKVPVQPFMLSTIISTARDMARNDYYNSRKVLRMKVSIHLFLGEDELAQIESDDPADGSSMVFGSEMAMEKHLEEVEATKAGGDCAICMEEIRVGSMISRMPCSHLFHRGCIVQWLQRSASCPLCRSPFPT